MTTPEMHSRALSMTLQDAAALALRHGAGTRIALGDRDAAPADIFAPAGPALTAQEAQSALTRGAGRIFFTFGNQAAAPDPGQLAPLLDLLIHRTGLGFMAASFAAPAWGRTVYHGHLFQDGRLRGNLHHAIAEHLSGRVAIIAHDIIAAGPQAIQAKLAACREQGIALALLDAIDTAQCSTIATALGPHWLVGGPAWLMPEREKPEPTAPTGRIAILSGALDRQTLYQLGAARGTLPFLQLDFTAPDVPAAALAWAAGQDRDFILSASAPPDQLARNIPVSALLADIAHGLAATGVKNLVITGNDTASAILARLGVKTLIAGAPSAGLRWLAAPGYNFLLKSAGFGGRNLFLDGFGPQIRLNKAAEWDA